METATSQVFFIPGLLPTLNELIRMKGAIGNVGHKGKRYDLYSEAKVVWEKYVFVYIRNAKIKRMDKAWVHFLWVEHNRKRNKDNVAGGGRKIIFDALVSAGMLKNDGWNEILGWRDDFLVYPGKEGIVVRLFPETLDLDLITFATLFLDNV